VFHIAFRRSSSSPPYPLPSSLPRTQVSTAGSTCTCTCTNSVAEYRLPCRAICAHPCAPPTCIRLYRYQRVNVESARTYTHIHIRAYMYVLAHTCIPQRHAHSVYMRYTWPNTRLYKASSRTNLLTQHIYSYAIQCTDQHVAKIRTYVLCTRVYARVSIARCMRVRAGVNAARTTLRVCSRVYASVALRILDIVRAHTITRTCVPFEFSTRPLFHRELFPRYTSNRFRTIRPLSWLSAHSSKRENIFISALKVGTCDF